MSDGQGALTPPDFLGLHAVSAVILGLACVAVALVMVELLRRRPDFRRGWAPLFVGFALACGLAHLLTLTDLGGLAGGVEGLARLLTALLGIAAAVALWRLSPRGAAAPLTSGAQAPVREPAAEGRTGERLDELEALNAQLRAALEEKTAAQQAQARSDAHFRASFESDAVGQVHYDPVSGRILRANRAHARMLGLEPEDIVGHLEPEFTYPEDRGRGAFTRLAEGSLDRYSREKRYVRKDGAVVWGRVSATMVRSPETNEPLLAVAVVEDIDDRHKAMRALADAKQDLEQVVEQRTAALAQRDLLLREVYHRVKNNLQMVDSLLLLEAHEVADPQAREALAGLRSRVFALGLVHHQLMGSEDLETFDVAPFLEELSAHLLEGAAPAGLQLSVRAAPLRADLDFAIPLGLLVTELVTNSIRHAFPDGRGAIEVTLELEEDGHVVLQVADNGPGALDPVARVGSLGRNLIQGLVAQLKGQLTTESGQGTRSTVRISPPLRTVAATVQEASA